MKRESPGLIAVEPRVVKEVLVDRLFDEATRLAAEPLPTEVAEILDDALAAVGESGEPERAAAVARLGYEARRAETQAFARAREPPAWLDAELSSRGAGAAVALSAELARREPEGPPDPADERAASWRVPGPGGHVRHWLAVRAAGTAAEPEAAVLRRAWFFGFYLRCCLER